MRRTIIDERKEMKRILVAAGIAAGVVSAAAHAGEAEIRQVLEKKYPSVKVQSVTKTPVPGIWEVYTNNGELLYSDDKAGYIFGGQIQLIDVARGVNLTEERMNKLSFVKFADLPFASSFKIVRGKGTRKIGYFADPNCGYCKKIEQDLVKLDDVTISVFVIPVLGQDSVDKARSIWCSKDRAKAWQDWMLQGMAPTAAGSCDTSAIDKAMVFARQKAINGTPTLFFTNDTRVPGAIPLDQIQQQLAAASGR
jgi:thiol:disulfide interchange protein DsbC